MTDSNFTRARFEAHLHDYIDGRLDAAGTRAMEAWLAAHPDDRAEVEKARALRSATASLSREVPPPRDLWPAVRAGIDEAGPRPAAAPRTWNRFAAGWIGLAASVVILAGATVTVLRLVDGADGIGAPLAVSRPVNGQPGAIDTGAGLTPAAVRANREGVDAELLAAEEAFVQATQRLMQVLESRRDRIPPDKLRFVEGNLETINTAIDEMRGALRSDPGNPDHGHALAAMYQKKMQLLWMASRLAETS